MFSDFTKFLIAMASRVKDNVQAPWVFATVLVVIGFTCFVLIDESVFGTITAFKFASVMVGVLGTQMISALAVRAMPTMFLMLIGLLLIPTVAAENLNSQSFQDAAFEHLMLGVAGSLGVLVSMLLERLKPVEKFRGMTLEAAVQMVGELQAEIRRLRGEDNG